MTFSSGDSRTVSVPTTVPVFAGFTFDTPITSVQFSSSTGNGYYAALDDFQYNQVAETPEANTVLLGGLGLASLLFARRLRRRS
jgi:hypothetical protein